MLLIVPLYNIHMKGLILWILGVPLGLIILLYLINVL
jgi:hypothetical protein